MKSYKTWEAIRELTDPQNKELVFESENDKFILKSVKGSGYIRFYTSIGNEMNLNGNINLFEDIWKLVQQPVSAIDAIKAFDKGKTIRWEHSSGVVKGEDLITINIYKHNNNSYRLIDNHDFPICSGELLRGKWFIEEEE